MALDCEVFGLPTPTVTWFMDGLTLDPCPPGQLSLLGEVCVSNGSVYIQSVVEEDTGRYTCRAENSAGVAVYEAFVSVELATCEYLHLVTHHIHPHTSTHAQPSLCSM